MTLGTITCLRFGGFGFIASNAHTSPVKLRFFRAADAADGFDQLREGQRVRFDRVPTPGDRGRFIAVRVAPRAAPVSDRVDQRRAGAPELAAELADADRSRPEQWESEGGAIAAVPGLVRVVRRQVRQRRASGDSLLAVMIAVAALLAVALGVVLATL